MCTCARLLDVSSWGALSLTITPLINTLAEIIARVVLQKVVEDRKLLGKGIGYAATPKISAMNFTRSLTLSQHVHNFVSF